jgi:hypothetical protein
VSQELGSTDLAHMDFRHNVISFSNKGNTSLNGIVNSYAQTYIGDYGSTAPVPEPETYAMMLGGLALLGVVARRRKQK